MFNYLKKAVATLAIMALMLANVNVSFAAAQTFNDVPPTEWFFPYVHDLVQTGVVDTKDSNGDPLYHPHRNLNRAELVKMVAEETGIIAGYVPAPNSSFTDVPKNAWYHKYVEVAYKNNIVSGYKDASGKLTGKFGPGNPVTRAEIAKMISNATNSGVIPTPPTPPAGAQGALFVGKANTAPKFYTKGTDGDALSLDFVAGGDDITIKDILLRVYGDDDGDFADGGDPTGDTDPVDYIADIDLYDGNTFIATKTMDLVGGTTFKANDGSVYRTALFDGLNITIAKDKAKVFKAVVSIKNSITTPFSYVALDIDPATDVVATDSSNNPVQANSGHLNYVAGAMKMAPYVEIVQPATPPTPPASKDLQVSKDTSSVKTVSMNTGFTDVPLLQVALKAGSVDTNISDMSFRVYGDDDGDFADGGDPVGDVWATDYVGKVYLYEGSSTTPLASTTLTTVGSGTFKANDSSNYNKADFSGLSINLSAGTTKKYMISFDMTSPMATPAYVAADMVPELDIFAVEVWAPNKVTVQPGTHLNYISGSKKMDPYIEITAAPVTKGTLTASVKTLNAGVVTAPNTTASNPYNIITSGSSRQVSQYTFAAQNEAFDITDLTIINDDSSQPDFDDAVQSGVIKSFKIIYPDSSGSLQTASCTPSGGMCTLTGLTFHVQKDSTANLDVYVETYPITSTTFSLSGKSIKVGLLDTTISGAVIVGSPLFKATGVNSGTITYFSNSGDIKNTGNVESYIYRKSKPVFTVSDQTSNLINLSGSDNLYTFDVTAEGGDVSFSRLVFKLNAKGKTPNSINDIWGFGFLKGDISTGTLVTGSNVWGQKVAGSGTPVATELTSGIIGLSGADSTTSGKVDDGNYYIVVTFDSPLVISSGSSETYTLGANISAGNQGDEVEVSFAGGDDNNPVDNIDLNYNNNNAGRNTAHVFGNGSRAGAVYVDGLFPGTLTPGVDAQNQYFNDHNQSWTANRNIIWSDHSGGDNAGGGGGSATTANHQYPTIAGSSLSGVGTVTPYSGTLDWTNGYNLDISSLKPYTFVAGT